MTTEQILSTQEEYKMALQAPEAQNEFWFSEVSHG